MNAEFLLKYVWPLHAGCTVTAQLSNCDVKMVKRGCFKDRVARRKKSSYRPLNKLLYNNRKNIDWGPGWNNYLHETVCK